MSQTAPDATDSDLPMHRETLAEEQRLQESLERARLEEDAKRSAISKWGWLAKILMLVALGLAKANSEYQYLINTVVIVYLVYGGNSQVHSRIDALQKLAELDRKKSRTTGE